MLELYPRDAELIDLILLFGCQMTLYVHKALPGGELCIELGGVETRERPYQFASRRGGVQDLLRIGIDGGTVERRSKQLPVPVDDVGAGRRRRRRHSNPRHMGLGTAAIEQHYFDNSQRDGREDAGE